MRATRKVGGATTPASRVTKLAAAPSPTPSVLAPPGLLSSVIDELDDFVAAMDTATGRLIVANPAASRVLGRSRDDLLADADLLVQVAHPDDRPLVAGAYAAARTGGRADIEHRVLHPGGAIRWVRLRLRAVADPGGGPGRVDLVIGDISRRKEAEQALADAEERARRLSEEIHRTLVDRSAELTAANAALERASRAKDEFVATMSHELRTPLNAVLGLSEALAEGVYGTIEPRGLRALERIQASGRHLLALINDILDLAKLESGGAALELSELLVADVCRECLAVIQGPTGKRRQAVSLALADGVDTVVADARMLRQMLVNLLSNATKFTPEGGSVGLEVGADPSRSAVRFTVWDSGIGIAEADLPKLFQPFVQIDGGLSRKHGGTGLGLSLVRKLAQLHGGSLEVESEPGRGSRFALLLPQKKLA